MKNNILRKLTMIMVVLILAMPVFAATTNIRVVVNGQKVIFPDAQPYMDANNRILIPVRFVSEELGAKVLWDKANQKVTISDDKNTVTLVIGQKQIKVNGVTKELDTQAIIKDTRTFVPIRFVSEALGATVEWDSKGKSVYINNNGKPIIKEKTVECEGFVIPLAESESVIKHSSGEAYDIYMKSKLSIGTTNPEHRKEYNSKTIMIALLPHNMTGADFDKQCNEMEYILQQQISTSITKQIMDYVKTKTHEDMGLSEKFFYSGEYKIRVNSLEQEPVGIYIYYK